MRDMELLERVQERATKMFKGLDYFTGGKAETAGTVWSRKEKAQGDFTDVYKHLKGS